MYICLKIDQESHDWRDVSLVAYSGIFLMGDWVRHSFTLSVRL